MFTLLWLILAILGYLMARNIVYDRRFEAVLTGIVAILIVLRYSMEGA